MTKTPDNHITYFARTTFRDKSATFGAKTFGIKHDDRFSHMYVIGKTGVGKSTLLETLIMQDIHAGHGIALIDPHGDLVEAIAASVPQERKDDLIYFNVPDPRQPWGYNPLSKVSPSLRPLVASGMLEVFKKMWKEAWGVRMEHILRNTLLALLDQEEATLADISPLFLDTKYRKQVVAAIQNDRVRDFWEGEFARYPPRFRAEALSPIQNKVGAFLADPTLLRVLTNPERPLSLRRVMDEGKILLVNLAKGRLGEDSAGLLGGLMVTALGLAAFSRASLPPEERRDFFLYLDEFQNFTTLTLANMLSELRKYRVGMVLVHQYLDQLDPDIRHAVLGNAGTLISFRLGGKDAPLIAREFEPIVSTEDLIELPNFHIFLRLMIDRTPSRAFSGVTVRLDS